MVRRDLHLGAVRKGNCMTKISQGLPMPCSLKGRAPNMFACSLARSCFPPIAPDAQVSPRMLRDAGSPAPIADLLHKLIFAIMSC